MGARKEEVRGDSPSQGIVSLLPAEGAQSIVSAASWEEIRRALRLSIREADITSLVLHNETNKTIAKKLCISSHTVHSHLLRLYRKLGINSREELIIRIFSTYVSHGR